MRHNIYGQRWIVPFVEQKPCEKKVISFHSPSLHVILTMFKLLLSFAIFFVTVSANIKFEVRRYRNNITVQEVITKKVDNRLVNAYMMSFVEKHNPRHSDNTIFETLVIKKVQRNFCSYHFQNNHLEHFSENLSKKYAKNLNKHNWYAYHQVAVPTAVDLEGCFDIFTHEYGSYFILSDKRLIHHSERINNFIRRYHIYESSNHESQFWTIVFTSVLVAFSFSVFNYCDNDVIKRKMKKLESYFDITLYPNNL